MHIDQKVKGVCFDLDQTLLSRDLAFRSLIHCWANATLSEDEYALIEARDQNGYGDRIAFFGWISEYLSLHLSAYETMLKFRAELPQHIRIEHDSIQLIHSLQSAGYQVGILTNGGSELQRAKLERSHIHQHLPSSHIIISADTPYHKPQKELFLHLCDSISLSPSEVIYIGDHYHNDALGAHRAGLHSVWLRHSTPIPPDHPKSIFMIEHLAEIEHILKKLG